jgi:hypothetical protein
MLKDGLKLTGKLSIAINNKIVREVPNLVVTDGKEYVASRMKDTTADAMSHMAIGTGSTAAAASNAALGAEAGRVSLASTTVTANEVEYVATFAAGTGTGAITEAGILNAASAGDFALQNSIFCCE